jgi:hypothetical protein
VSPYQLCQELAVQREPKLWRLITACALLNKTSGNQVRPMIERFWELCGEPVKCIRNVRTAEVAALLQPLGLYTRRASLLARMAEDYLSGTPLERTVGVGKYALDSVKVFIEGHSDVVTDDPWINKYLEWRRSPECTE